MAKGGQFSAGVDTADEALPSRLYEAIAFPIDGSQASRRAPLALVIQISQSGAAKRIGDGDWPISRPHRFAVPLALGVPTTRRERL